MLKFYDIDKDYIEYLRKYESKIPNISYDKHDKFICGVVLNINGKKFYAPVSSFNKQQRTNILLKNSKGKVTSSIRLSFMFPVPDEKITMRDFSKEDIYYRRLLIDEYKFCNKHEKEILDKARYIYKSVTQGLDTPMVKNCCDFKNLEHAYDQYLRADKKKTIQRSSLTEEQADLSSNRSAAEPAEDMARQMIRDAQAAQAMEQSDELEI